MNKYDTFESQIGNCDLPSKLFDSGSLTHLLPLTQYPLEKTMNNNITELTAHMRGLAEAATHLDHNESPNWYNAGELLEFAVHYPKNARFIEAISPANVITILDALDAAQAEQLTDKALVSATLKQSEAMLVEHKAALARLAELNGQKPVGMFFIGPVTGLYQPVHQERPTQTKDYIPLYAAAGASPVQPSQAVELSDEEINTAWHDHWSNPSVPSTACSAFHAGVRYAVAAINALRAAIAAQEPEPVGHLYTIAGVQHCTINRVLEDGPLYTAPPDTEALRKELEQSYREELDKVSQRNYELRKENEAALARIAKLEPKRNVSPPSEALVLHKMRYHFWDAEDDEPADFELFDAGVECDTCIDVALVRQDRLDELIAAAGASPQPSQAPEGWNPSTNQMTPERAAYFMRRFKHEEKLLGPNEQAAVDYVIALLEQPSQAGELTQVPAQYTRGYLVAVSDAEEAIDVECRERVVTASDCIEIIRSLGAIAAAINAKESGK